MKSEKRTLREIIDAYIAPLDKVLSPSTIRGYITIRNTRFLDVIDKPIKDINCWQSVINNESNLVAAKTLKNS